MEGRISENKDKRSDEDQRKIDQQRIAKNIINMASSFQKKPDEAKTNNWENVTEKNAPVIDKPNTAQIEYMPE